MNTFYLEIYQNEKLIFRLIPSLFHYYADPFILHIDEEKVEILVEEYLRFTQRGRIVVLRFLRKSNKISKTVLLSENYHLSYPFVFKLFDSKFFSPESSEIGKQFIYKILRDGSSYKCLPVYEIAQRMVDATFFNSNCDHRELDVIFYTGIGNNDGLLINGKIFLGENKVLNMSGLKVIGNFRPAGFVNEKVLPVQRREGKYGEGFTFLETIESKTNNTSTFMKTLMDRGHHISVEKTFIAIDVFSSLKLKLIDKVCAYA